MIALPGLVRAEDMAGIQSADGSSQRGRALLSIVLTAGLLAWNCSAADAGLTSSTLDEVSLTPSHGARLPLETPWQDENGSALTLGQAMDGRPALLIFADYTCHSLCGPVLRFTADTLAGASLDPRDYRLIVLGLDPNDGPDAASAMKRDMVTDAAVASATRLLTADAATIHGAANAAKYSFQYDSARDQFAHPAAVLVLTPDGRVSRVLSGLGISSDDFRLALMEAGSGRIGTPRDHVRLLCYGFDPVAGVYTLSIYRSLAAATLLTLVVFGAAIAWMSIWPRRTVSGPSR